MKHLLLVGGGHAHAVVLHGLARKPLPGARVTLVTPRTREIYTGMFPGVVAGHYAEADAQMDFALLAAGANAELVEGEVAELDPARRTVWLADGREIPYDFLSLDVGSVTAPSIPGARENGVPLKPFGPFLAAWEEAPAQQVAFIGGGAAGVELAMAVRRRGGEATVYSEGSPFAPMLQKRIAGALRRLRVNTVGLAVSALEAGPVVVAGTTKAAYEAVILATGPAAPRWLGGTGLATDEHGFVLVGATLQSVSHPDVFAAGDCATLRDAPHRKSGVYAVRHGQALLYNLGALFRGEPLKPYRPQRRALLIITCGHKYAIADWGGMTAEGRWVWWWKAWIDRRWVARFRK